jgi:uncharacterized protein YndB with AHSA1/START domain
LGQFGRQVGDTTYDLSSTRTLPVPPAQAWKAWAEAACVKLWWGPNGFRCRVADVEFREGGRTLVCMSAPGFGDIFNTWTYNRIVPHERIEYVLRFTDASGTPHDPPMPGVPSEVPHVVTFARSDGGTTLTVSEFGYGTAETAEISKAGLEQCLDKLVTIYTQ